MRVTNIRKDFYNDIRKPVRVSLGPHILGATMPVPDLNHGPSQLTQISKRVGANMPNINRARLRSFKRFVKRFCRKYLTSLQFDDTEAFDFEEWIAEAPYEAYRKDELRQVYNELLERNEPSNKIKAFIKDEPYEDWKHLRGIYSRSDDYKVLVGPFFQKFGDRLFNLKYFIKKVPVELRPEWIVEKMGEYENLFCTDFSCYEATFVEKLMAIEHWVYMFALENHPDKKKYNDLIAKMRSLNTIDFKNFTIKLLAKRMSGEMNTSCGNGLMNLLITFFILEQRGNDLDKDVVGFFEGDDGVNKCKYLPREQDYRDLGCNIKIEIPPSLAEASFCGNVFVPGINHNVTNPMEASVRFGWTYASRYRHANDETKMSLLLAKSMSMLYEYPGCPILKSLGQYGMRVSLKHLGHVNKKEKLVKYYEERKNGYYRQTMLDMLDYIEKHGIPNHEIHIETRLLVERLYGISVEAQHANERYLDSLDDVQPLSLDLPWPKSWKDNDMYYTRQATRHHDPHFERKGFVTAAWHNRNKLVFYHH